MYVLFYTNLCNVSSSRVGFSIGLPTNGKEEPTGDYPMPAFDEILLAY